MQMAGFMDALRAKGETITELDALANGMLAKATPIDLPRSLRSMSSGPAVIARTR